MIARTTTYPRRNSLVRKGAGLRALSACGLGLLGAALNGCSEIKLGTQEQKPNPNIFPANYKAELLAFIQKMHPDDMLNVQSAHVSSPMQKQSGSEAPYFVCVRTESLNGRKYQMTIFFDGQVNQFIDATAEQCGSAAYQPFPELTALIRRLAGAK
jgi:hypothetical protein